MTGIGTLTLGSKMIRKIALLYLVCIHLILFVVVTKSNFIERVINVFDKPQNEISAHFKAMTAFHSRIDKNISAESIVFIGDSHIQGLAVSAVTEKSVNYGIGGDTTFGVLKRLPTYQALSHSKAVVLAIGFNDLRFRSNNEIIANVEKILAQLPNQLEIILCAIHPVGQEKHEDYNKRIRDLNESYRNLSLRYSNVSYLDAFKDYLSDEGYLPSKYHLIDAIHLSKQGYNHWILALKAALEK